MKNSHKAESLPNKSNTRKSTPGETAKKKVVIIGAGISGLAAGIYLLDNGYDVTVYEKHFIPGGECTGWTRNGTFIDGCAHWIVGTNKESELFPLWKHVGAFDENTKIIDPEYFCKYDIGGEVVTLYADPEKLKAELLRVAPEDKKQIEKFIKCILKYRHVKIPVDKPVDYMNIFELIAYGSKMLPMVFTMLKYKKKSSEEFAGKFKSPVIKELVKRLLDGNYNVHTLFYIFQTLSKNDAGIVEGGSKNMALRICDRFISGGGKLVLNSPVKNVIVENKTAKGVALFGGERVFADYVISSADAHHTLYDLLEGNFNDKYYESRFNDRKTNPLNSCVFLSYRYSGTRPVDEKINFEINEYKNLGLTVNHISIRNHFRDETLNDGHSAITVMVPTSDKVFDNLKMLNKDDYVAFKKDIGKFIGNEIVKYYGLSSDDLTLIDVATPVTYERYVNAYRGSYMSFITTAKSKGLMRKGVIKGLKNFVMCGQWIMPPGGLPIALFSGKHAACRVCKADKKKFINLEKSDKPVAKIIPAKATV